MPFVYDSFIHPDLIVRFIGKREKGVFAKKTIRKGEVLAITSGHVIPLRTLKKLSPRIQKYCYHIENNYYLCPRNAKQISPDLYINHSCSPNSGGARKYSLTAIAIKKLKKAKKSLMTTVRIIIRGSSAIAPGGIFNAVADRPTALKLLRRRSII